MKPELDTELIAQHAHAFLATDFGQWYLTTLQEEFDSLVNQALKPLESVERKAMRIERAAGTQFAIALLKDRAKEHESA